MPFKIIMTSPYVIGGKAFQAEMYFNKPYPIDISKVSIQLIEIKNDGTEVVLQEK